jgi:hypothetical protein
MGKPKGRNGREDMSQRGQRMSFKVCAVVLNKPQIKGETKLQAATPTASNGAEGISDIEGKATRVGASERGQRMSFK